MAPKSGLYLTLRHMEGHTPRGWFSPLWPWVASEKILSEMQDLGALPVDTATPPTGATAERVRQHLAE